MRNVYRKEFLSESDNGRPITIDSQKSLGQLLHKTPGNIPISEIWLYASVIPNAKASDMALSLCFGSGGGTALYIPIPAGAGPVVVVPGWVLGPNEEVSARWESEPQGILKMVGYVHTISPAREEKA